MVEDIATGAGGLGFDSRVGSDIVSPTARHCCFFFRSCVAGVSRGDDPTTRYMLRRNPASRLVMI